MIKFLMTVLFVLTVPSDSFARAVKLGDLAGNQKTINSRGSSAARTVEISCFENKDCSYDKECVALRCESVCKHGTCPIGTYCAPVSKEKPHTFQCVECVVNMHCNRGMFCDRDYTCKVPDPCEKAVCPTAAPYCIPKPFKTLPYTCVQCTENAHCPPVAGLTRSCVEGNCLFNIDGNLPQKQETTEMIPATDSPFLPEEAEDVFVEEDPDYLYEEDGY